MTLHGLVVDVDVFFWGRSVGEGERERSGGERGGGGEEWWGGEG